jgi:hypothetical protein
MRSIFCNNGILPEVQYLREDLRWKRYTLKNQANKSYVLEVTGEITLARISRVDIIVGQICW